MYPFTCARAVGAARHGHTKQGRGGGQREAEAQDNAKAKNTKKQRDGAGSPGKILAGAARPHQWSKPPLSPPVPTQPTTLGPGLGRHHRGGMQIFVKIINTPDQMRTRRWRPSARSLPRKATRPRGKILAGDDCAPWQDPCRTPGKALAEDISEATARPAPAKFLPSFACSC